MSVVTTHRPWSHDEIVGLRIAIGMLVSVLACAALSVAAALGKLDG